MAPFSYADIGIPIRADIATAHREFWNRLARAGSWWTGAERVAIAQESRNAVACAFCKRRKTALSPYGGADEHDHDNALLDFALPDIALPDIALPDIALPGIAIDAVHRIITDQSRITRAYIESNVARGLSKEAYVELVGVVVAVFSIDEFHRALGVPLEPLPAPVPGDISRYRPANLREDIGFVPTVPPEGAVGPEADLWKGGRAANVIRALTLVPDALRDWRALAGAQYLSFAAMANFVKDDNRALDRMQMELVAARVSSINECFY